MPRYKELKDKKVMSLTLEGRDYDALRQLAEAEEIAVTEKVRRMIVPFLREFAKAKEQDRRARLMRPLRAEEERVPVPEPRAAEEVELPRPRAR